MLNLKTFLNTETVSLHRINQRGCDYTQNYQQIKQFYQQKNILTHFFEQNQIRIKKLANIISTDQQSPLRLEAIYFKKINQIFSQICTMLQTDLSQELQKLPNIPHLSVPIGDVKNNQVVRQKLDYPNQSFAQLKQQHFQSHEIILKQFAALETTNTVLMTQPRFVTYQGFAAQLLRALQNFLFDYHYQNHYQEVATPYLTTQAALFHTGQFPKAQNDCYKLENTDLYLLPTAEVTLLNLFQKKLFQPAELPLKLAAYSPCFRKEAGAAGKDTRGIIRLHQFHKIELVQFCLPSVSYATLETMTTEVSRILELLQIPYQVVNLASADLAFQAAKTYDLEVWWPSQQKFLEISSLSNTESFQTTSLQIKYLVNTKTKMHVHALNASGLALDRLLAIIIEYAYQPKTKQFNWPSALHRYLPRHFLT